MSHEITNILDKPRRTTLNLTKTASHGLTLWIVLRIMTLGWAAYCAQFPVAATTISSRLERWLLQPWLRWDTFYYLQIAERGYRLDDGTAQFHPLFPLLGGLVGRLLGGNMLLGLLVVSSLSGLGVFIALGRLAELDLAPVQARRAVLYFALTPVAFILFAPYSEALFLLCSILAILLARQERWWLAGLCGALATLTRQQGLFLLVPLGWELWERSGYRPRILLRDWRNVASLALVPLGLLVWLIYRAVALGDVAVDWREPRTLIYSLLISKSSAQVVPIQGFIPPWQAFWRALMSLRQPGSFTTKLDLVFGGVALIIFILQARRLWQLRRSYLLYSVVIMLVSFAYYTGPHFPYMGLPRHCLLAFPIVFALALAVRSSAVQILVLSYGLLGFLTLLFFYSVTMRIWTP